MYSKFVIAKGYGGGSKFVSSREGALHQALQEFYLAIINILCHFEGMGSKPSNIYGHMIHKVYIFGNGSLVNPSIPFPTVCLLGLPPPLPFVCVCLYLRKTLVETNQKALAPPPIIGF